MIKINDKTYPLNSIKNSFVNQCIEQAWNSLGTINQYKMLTPFTNNLIKRFSFVVAMPIPLLKDLNPVIGYLVQIRKKSGIFNSDMILIRTINGELIPWENQSFLIIPQQKQTLLESIFKDYINEDTEFIKNNGKYTIEDGKYPYNEYIVNNKK